MEVMFIDARYDGTVELCQETLDYLKRKKYKRIGLYSSVQFVNNLKRAKEQLKQNNAEIIVSKPKRAHQEGQLLGCDIYNDSLNLNENVDCYLYVGDGKFHPLALVYAQKNKNKKEIKEVICNDPLRKEMFLLSFDNVKKTLKRYHGALVKFLSSGNIGVIISIKPGQEHLKPALKLEEKYPTKRFYYFIDNSISFDQLENFPFIDVWVNTACPRIALDEHGMFPKSVVNLSDVLNK